jgi:hypothetical protein
MAMLQFGYDDRTQADVPMVQCYYAMQSNVSLLFVDKNSVSAAWNFT